MSGKTVHSVRPLRGAANRDTQLPGWLSIFNFLVASSAGRGILALFVLVLVAAIAIAPFFPRIVTPASAAADVFSGERAMTHLPVIARQPHPTGSQAQAAVRDYLVQQLTSIGLQPDIQTSGRLENVLARLPGTDPTGAIVVLAHYDSTTNSPGAADNGSGVSVLLEILRAITAGPPLRNDVIALFDDSEEYGPFLGTRLFVNQHPWMETVQIAISLDTAVAGPIVINETGPENGWLVDVLARAGRSSVWSSISGGGRYDSYPFRQKGIQVLSLEDNYPFKEQHTPNDLPTIVNPGSVQQMGDLTLAVTRELGALDLTNPRGAQSVYFTLPVIGFIHYPESWALPLAVIASVLFLLAIGLTLWRGWITWRGALIALAATLAAAVITAVIVNMLAEAIPDFVGWQPRQYSEWPEVIPPNGGFLFLGLGLLALVLALAAYIFARRWSARAEFSLAGVLPFWILSLGLAIAVPSVSYLTLWPVIIGALCWLGLVAAGRRAKAWAIDLVIFLTALPFAALVLPIIPKVFMSDGLKSLAIEAGLWVLLLAIFLPVADSLFLRGRLARTQPGLTRP